eukprot:Rhum_TRINITY_DN13532_c1_g1::Rhum_TRINITY_DN13532_c1_g1_i1::g.61165::m.61165/K09702/K09702; uncharacterized protein
MRLGATPRHRPTRRAWLLVLAASLVQFTLTVSLLTWWRRGGGGGSDDDGGARSRRAWKQQGSSTATSASPGRGGAAGAGVGAPLWVREKTSDDGGRLRLHEVFDARAAAGGGSGGRQVAWSPGRRSRLVIPDVKPAGWTPVSPLSFDCPALHWFNKPSGGRASIDAASGNLLVRAEGGSGFWQGDAAGRAVVPQDSGHFLHVEVVQETGETVAVSGRFALASARAGDQVGLMVRRGAGAWVGVSLEKGALATVVTNEGRSDYSATPWARGGVGGGGGGAVSLRLSIEGNRVEVRANGSEEEDEEEWTVLRRGLLYDIGDEAETHYLSVGVFAAAPVQEGMLASVGYFSISVS